MGWNALHICRAGNTNQTRFSRSVHWIALQSLDSHSLCWSGHNGERHGYGVFEKATSLDVIFRSSRDSTIWFHRHCDVMRVFASFVRRDLCQQDHIPPGGCYSTSVYSSIASRQVADISCFALYWLSLVDIQATGSLTQATGPSWLGGFRPCASMNWLLHKNASPALLRL